MALYKWKCSNTQQHLVVKQTDSVFGFVVDVEVAGDPAALTPRRDNFAHTGSYQINAKQKYHAAVFGRQGHPARINIGMHSTRAHQDCRYDAGTCAELDELRLPTRQPTIESINQPTNQSTEQPTSQPNHQPTPTNEPTVSNFGCVHANQPTAQ